VRAGFELEVEVEIEIEVEGGRGGYWWRRGKRPV
jgi:hypothetical protein